MPVSIESTPNPNALKLSVGKPVGGPTTFVAGKEHDDPMAGELLGLEGVTSVFLTADFVTVSKTPEATWETLGDTVAAIVEKHLG